LWQGHCRSLDQAFAQTALTPKALFGAAHLTRVALVVVAEQVQQPMQSQDPELGQLRVPRFPSLSPRHSSRDYDLS
jgi:hypothetical protein